MGAKLSTQKDLESINSDNEVLNSYNKLKTSTPGASDVVVVGAGIHSLIYAIHTRKLELEKGSQGKSIAHLNKYIEASLYPRLRRLTVIPIDPPSSITIFEKSSTPGYKIGESTLTVFGLWLKLVGIDTPMLRRLFGPKDGLAFYYFASTEDPEA